GSARLLQESGLAPGELAAEAQRLQGEGRSVSWLLRRQPEGGARLLGLLAFGDELKPSARAAIDRLRALGIDTVMLSGDNRGSAEAVGRQLGMTKVHAEVLPADKAGLLQTMRRGGQQVAMVGDGINDAPALAAAD